MNTFPVIALIAIIVAPLALLAGEALLDLTPSRREEQREADRVVAAHQARRNELRLQRRRASQLRHEAKRAEYQLWLDRMEADPQLKLSMPNTYANAIAYLSQTN